jgi:hypothetical protein
MPPFANPGPQCHPALPPSGLPGGHYGVPPGVQRTTGNLLAPAEVQRRRGLVQNAINQARATRPLAAANLQHWLDNTGGELRMSSAPFLNPESGLEAFLQNTVRRELEAGIRARLTNANHQQGSLQPPGVVRFLQYRSGTRPSATGGVAALITGRYSVAADLSIAVGAYYIHSTLWVRARPNPAHSGGFLGLGQATTWTVDILRWAVQVYDAYDWNLGAQTAIPIPPGVSLQNQGVPLEALNVQNYPGGIRTATTRDDWFRDLEVSGGGRAYLIYTDPFPAPAAVMGPFTVRVS